MKNVIIAGSKESSILRQNCYPIEIPGDQVTADMIIGLLKEVLDSHGSAAGVAAPQIGYNKQIAVIHKSVMGSKEHLVLINPEVKTIGADTVTEVEGCLSFPGLSKRVKRFKNITVSTFLSASSMNKVTIKLTGFPSRAVQHEVDHLNGITILEK